MFKKVTQSQIDKVLVDEGVVFVNFGETDAEQLGVIRGGSEFTATGTFRDIAFDAQKGKSKGLKVLEELNAMMKLSLISFDQKVVAKLSALVEVGATTPFDLTSTDVGVVKDAKYLKNVTMFCKTLDGKFKKVTLYNALNEAALVISAKPKAEGELPLEIHGHWDAVDDTKKLFKVEELATLPAS